MARFNQRSTPVRATGPAQGTGETTATHEGGAAYVRTSKTDLVFLALTNFVGQDTFYESASNRDDRFRTLVRNVAADDPEWTGKFIAWLRGEAHMRTASLVAAAETAHVMLEQGVPGARKVIDGALMRADEPGEFLGYWIQAYGDPTRKGAPQLPMAVKRGVGDAALRLYNERSLLKYDTGSHGLRFGDVIELTHAPDTKGAAQHLVGPWQGDLFTHAIDRRHARLDREIPDSLAILHANKALRAEAKDTPEILLSPEMLWNAGMTWEDAKSLGGQFGLDSKAIWEAMIPSMGYMALLRNLRNFDQAGVSDAMAAMVAQKLMTESEVARSRQLPFRFWSAVKELDSVRWSHPLDVALKLSCSNVPAVPGKTLVLVDTSGSMNAPVSERSKLMRSEAGALFGAILATRGHDVTLVAFATDPVVLGRPNPGASPLTVVKKVLAANTNGWGTETAKALRQTYAGHDQVFVFTDEQSWPDSGHGYGSPDRTARSWGYGGYTTGGDVTNAVPASVPLFSFNLGGYAPSMLDLTQPNRYAIGGFSDKLFLLVKQLLAGRDAKWPWEE